MQAVLIEDDPFTRDGIALFLRRRQYTVYEADNAASGKELLRAKRPSIAIIDILIPANPGASLQRDQNKGVELACWMKERLPESGVVLFSAYDDRGEAIIELIQAGVSGVAYLLKGSGPASLLAAMEMAQAGRVYIDPEVTNQNRLARRFWETLSAAERPHVQHGAARISLLTPREQNVAQRIAASHTVNGIANALDLAPKTVENYTARVYRKLDLKGIESKGLRPSVLLAKIYLWHKLKGGEREKS